LGLIAASRTRQLAQLAKFIDREIPVDAVLVVAGDFNSPLAPVKWAQSAMKHRVGVKIVDLARTPTFPSRLPLVQLDHVFARHVQPTASHVPRGAVWARMSDHLPLIVDFDL
jgi:endonuclease/exonuclease/phosphatase family metal-dependent hydrolase